VAINSGDVYTEGHNLQELSPSFCVLLGIQTELSPVIHAL